MKAKKDYSKPFYIRGVHAKEIFFDCLLGEPVDGVHSPKYEHLTDQYNVNMAVSLESAKMEALCPLRTAKSQKTEKQLSDALIKVVFSEDRTEKSDFMKRCAETLDNLDEQGLSDSFKDFLSSYHKYQQCQKSYNEIKAEENNTAAHTKAKQKLKDSKVQYHKTFNKVLKDGRQQTTIREFLYQNGFDALTDGEVFHYVMYKRSANMAKKGDCLFIREDLYQSMMKWSWLDLDIDDIFKGNECDLASIKAYETLASASMIGTAKIQPKNILMLESVESPPVSGNIRIMRQTGDRLILTRPNEDEQKQNIIWDGQALVDESVFTEAGFGGNGMMYLRNRFFKACAFNAKISEYYKAHNITEVTDVYGEAHKASDIKMIVTVDSLKILKFAKELYKYVQSPDKVKCINTALKEEAATYSYWRQNVSEDFAVVKVDKSSSPGEVKYHRISYQILNTFPLQFDEVKKLMEKELSYIDLLKTNDAVFLHHIWKHYKSDVRYFIFIMYLYYKNFENTSLFKKYRQTVIDDYRDRLRTGELNVKSDFYTLCSMPLEMLEYSCIPYNERSTASIHSYLGPDEAYIKGFKGNREASYPICRYPHMGSGSIAMQKIKSIEEYDRWLNFTYPDGGSNIIAISPWESNIMTKLGGADFDSDQVIFIMEEIFEKAVKRLRDRKALKWEKDGLPVAEADGALKKEKATYKYDTSGLAELDAKIAGSQKSIGSIANISQIFNCLILQEYNREHPDEEYIKTLHECSLKLSVLEELEIDNAKHNIDLDIKKEVTAIKDTTYNGEKIVIDKNLPNFLIEKKKDEPEYKWEKNRIKDVQRLMRYIRKYDESKQKSHYAPDISIEEVLKIISADSFDMSDFRNAYYKKIKDCKTYDLKDVSCETGDDIIKEALYDAASVHKGMRLHKKNKNFWDCTADYVGRIAAEHRLPRQKNIKADIDDILESSKDYGPTLEKYACDDISDIKKKIKYDQVEDIKRLLLAAVEELDNLRKNIKDENEREEKRAEIQMRCREALLSKRSISPNTIKALYLQMYVKYKNGEYRYPEMHKNLKSCMGLLFAAGHEKAVKKYKETHADYIYEDEEIILPWKYEVKENFALSGLSEGSDYERPRLIKAPPYCEGETIDLWGTKYMAKFKNDFG